MCGLEVWISELINNHNLVKISLSDFSNIALIRK